MGLFGLPALVPACAREEARSPATSLLADRAPLRSAGVSRPRRLDDGVAPIEGNPWRSPLTSVFASPRAFVDWDLGRRTPIRCALLQGDDNDAYSVSVSDDGRTFTTLWLAGPGGGSGMRTRLARGLLGAGRFVRLAPAGGDGRYSVGEIALYPECPAAWPPPLDRRAGPDLTKVARRKTLLFGLLAALFLLGIRRPAPRAALLFGALPAAAAISLGADLVELWPVDEALVILLRAVLAGVAGTFFLCELLGPRKLLADRRLDDGILALLALASLGCFFHLGSPQFRDEAKGRPTFVHPWDLRVYFPLAKYFEELRFDGLYLASLAAYVDNNPSLGPAAIRDVEFRDLRNNEVHRAAERMDEIERVRERFAPARWDDFKRDMKYFQDVMGAAGYLGSLRDHGGNATPVWLLPAHAIFSRLPANELTLTLAGLIDPLLLILLFLAVGRAYGLRAMLVAAIVFGVTDFCRFGTNLMGSTLRYDWMAALGFGACALKRRGWMLGGAWLAYAGLIRAFPALAAIFLAAPALVWAVESRVRARRFPSLDEWRASQAPAVRALAGAALGVVALGVASSIGPLRGSWEDWTAKIAIHAEKPNINSVGLRTLVAFEADKVGSRVLRPDLPEPWTDWQRWQRAAFERRRPLFYAGIAFFAALALAACRRRRLDQAALVGLFLVPVIFYPANYYLHCVFLLPLVATDGSPPERPAGRLFSWCAFVLLAMSAAQYFTLPYPGDQTYAQQSAILLVGFAAMLAPLVSPPRDDSPASDGRCSGAGAPERGGPPRPPPAPSAAPRPRPLTVVRSGRAGAF